MLPGEYVIHRVDAHGFPFYDERSRARVQTGKDVSEVDEEM